MVSRVTMPALKIERPKNDATLFKRILLVENDPLLRMEVCDLLDLHFYDFTVVTSAADAIRELIHGKYDALICDLTMENFPGEMFFEAVHRVRPELCKCFISINSADQTNAAHKVGVVRIWKPLDPQVLLEALETVLKKNERLAPELPGIFDAPTAD